MVMLSASSVQALRRLNDGNLPHRALLVGVVQSVGAGGAIVETSVTLASDVACKVVLVSPVRETIADRVTTPHECNVVFSVDADLKGVRRITVTGPVQGNAQNSDDGPEWRRVLDVLYEIPEDAGNFRRTIRCRDRI